jgi:hypothetical protein
MPSKFKVEFAEINWTEFNVRLASRRIPGIFIILLAALFFHQMAGGVLGAGTALSVGFAANRQLCGSRLLAMVVTASLMAACAFLGTLAGNCYELALASAVAGGFVCGLFSLTNEDSGWIAMQGIIAFIIGSSFAGLGSHALERAACILIGGLTQSFCILIIWHLENISRFGEESHLAAGKTGSNSKNRFNVFNDAIKSKVGVRFGLRVAITLGMAVEIAHLMNLQSDYWLPMTTLIVLKPDFTRTYTGGVQRVAGTLTGVVLASLMAIIFRPSNNSLLALVTLSAWGTFLFQKVNPVMFSAALTFCVVVLIAMTGLPESTVTWHRLAYTFLGCLLALISHFIGFFIIHRNAPLVAKSFKR